MAAFFCDECDNLCDVKDRGVAQAIVYRHLATGGGLVCPLCCPVTDHVALPLFSFEKEESSEAT